MKIRLGLLIAVALGIMVFSQVLLPTPRADAISYNYTSYPMDDSTYRASFTMSVAAIQTFLQNEGSSLATFSDTETCGNDSRGAMMSVYSSSFSCGTTQLASKIIYDAAQAYGINPQVLLATMQKEQSLVTTPNPIASQLNYAMGYGCPDSGSCYLTGFFNQVAWAAWQFRYDYEAINGNSYGGWAASAYPCNGATKYYSAALKTGNNVTFYDDYGTGYANFTIPDAATGSLYCYTPHVFPGSPQEYYSGSYWFVYYFTQWFGTPAAPYAFKSSTNATVYIFAGGYKIAVPSMAMLQDYGINPAAIQILDQNTVNSIASPDIQSGVSSQLSYLLKSPTGSTVYLVSLGQRYTLASYQQYATDYGFSSSEISYLPQSFIDSLPNAGVLSDFIQTPSSNVFQVSNGQKNIILDSATYASLNTSGTLSRLSGYVASTIASGLPITNREILIGNTAGTIYLFDNGSYYALPSIDVYNCWGFGQTLNTPVYMLSDNSFIAPITNSSNLSCVNNTDSSTTYILNSTNKISIPSSLGLSAPIVNTDLASLMNKIPQRSNQLGQIIKTSSAPTVWYIENGVKKSIPSLSDLALLGFSGSQIDIIGSATANSIPTSGIKLGIGQVVKTIDNGGVYVITSSNSRTAFASSDDFMAYNYNWSSIEIFPSAILNQFYPTNNGVTISKYLYAQASNKVYLVDHYGCYVLSSSQLTSYGQVQSSIQTGQDYGSTIFPYLNLASCTSANVYVKSPNLSTVYWIDSSNKYPISSWSKLVSLSGQTSPVIINLSDSTLATLPTGTTL